MVHICKRSLKCIHDFEASFLDREWSDKLDMLSWQIVMKQYTWGNQNYCSSQSSILILPLRNGREQKFRDGWRNHLCKAVGWNTRADITEGSIWTVWPVLRGNLVRIIGIEHWISGDYLFELQNEWKYEGRVCERSMVQHNSLFPFWPWISHYVQFKDFPGRVASKPMWFGAFFFFFFFVSPENVLLKMCVKLPLEYLGFS